jgi:hypothetical protein
VQLDKKKPGIGSTRGLNLAAHRPTTVQVSDCRFCRLVRLNRTKCWFVFCEWCVKCVYFLLNPWGKEKERNLRWSRVW